MPPGWCGSGPTRRNGRRVSKLILAAIELAIRVIGAVVLTWSVQQLREWAERQLAEPESSDEADNYIWEEECL